MTKIKSLLTFILLVSLAMGLNSCGSKKKGKTNTKISLGAFVSGIPQNGGVLIVGHTLNDSSGLSIGLDAIKDDPVLELENGNWEFYAIAWQGDPGLVSATVNANFTGQVRCAYSGVHELKGGETTIPFTLNSPNCTKPIPDGSLLNDPSAFVGDQYTELKIRSCQLLPGAVAAGSCNSTTNSGLTKSYRVEVFGAVDNNSKIVMQKSLQSRCIKVSDQNDSGEYSKLKLPIGTANDHIVSPAIWAYQSEDCSGFPVFYHFKDGLVNNLSEENKSSYIDVNSLHSGENFLLLEHNAQTPTGIGKKDQFEFFFGTGQDGDNAALSGTPNYYYKITNISADAKTISVSSAPALSRGQEIMWFVNAEGTVGDCAGFNQGNFGFARIKEDLSGGVFDLYDEMNFNDKLGSFRTLPLNTNLTAATNTTNYCSMQIVTVPNYKNVNVTGDTFPTAYTHGTGIGGILVMRVHDTLTMDASGSAKYLKSTDNGFLSYVPDYSSCSPTNDCVRMGQGDSTNRGGGVTIIIANTLSVQNGGGTVEIKANSTLGTTAGGTTLVLTNILNFLNNFSLSLIHSNGASAGGGAAFNYCEVQGAGTVPAPVTLSGATGMRNVDSNPEYCALRP